MSWDIYAVHCYGIDTEDIYDAGLRIKSKFIEDNDYSDFDAYDIWLDNEAKLHEKCKYVHVVPIIDNFVIGVPICSPWNMKIKDKQTANECIQEFLEYFYDNVPKNFAQKNADEIFYGFMDE